MTLFPFSFALFTIADTINSSDDINEEKVVDHEIRYLVHHMYMLMVKVWFTWHQG